ncbi:glycine betaine ABC transporter substrate-binding protein [Oceanobacillus sp. J11TS1]|uniref:glycine betaine ABC transporter substrate-binding protein n=1 Tax=Oceanobacillus sp. J11TS1 TaxID=2807191 RepID=UPI001B296769|nr:glycine betaine ABC transporter substrate-binding protein [Oceanobacillus sp. J11TS1]GIO24292.1 glycine/betaine ABC transporter [Oceanobacillus sp. J11TS1]
MFQKQREVMFIITTILILLLSACGSDSSDESSTEKGSKTIDLGQTSWEENIAITNMWKIILEEEGYEVNLHLLDIGTQMAALENDELDISPEIWLPVQDAEYVKQYEDTVDFSEETWYDNAKVGLVVPSYMDNINSIEDLHANKENLNAEITGFDAGAGTMLVVEDVIEDYELDYELISSSEPAMLTALQEAINKKDEIVIPLWNPHRVFAEMDLKYLNDPKNIFGDSEKIYHATRQGFHEDYPEIDQWFKNWKMNDEQIGELMSYVGEAENEGKKAIEGAEKWVNENNDLVNQWLEK